MKRVTPFSERFWKHVQKTENCWLWAMALDKDGYGSIRVGGTRSAAIRAHRASYQIHFGEIPEGMLVCHRCDNPPCVRPDHLFLGTQADNVHDMDAKGRRPRGDESWQRLRPERLARGIKNGAHTKPERVCQGEANGRAILTEDAVREIREMWETGLWTQGAIAKSFGVSQRTVSVITRRIGWKHVA